MSPKPEPAWWAEARRMRAEGWKCIALAAYFNVSETAIQYALHSRVRARYSACAKRRLRNMTPEQRLHLNSMDRAAYARRKERNS